MDRELILGTTFLVDLEREVGRQRPGRAQRFLEARPDARLGVTLTTAGEMATGMGPDDRARWEDLLRGFRVLPSGPDVCWRYGRLFRFLRENGLLIGTNDLWIAATALVHELPLVTRNESHFRRVPDLRVVGYGD